MTVVADRMTPASPRDVFESMKRVCVNIDGIGALSDRAILVMLAQWGLETGIGHAMHCNNIGNIKGKPDSSDGHDCTFFRCDEQIPVRDASGKVVIDPLTGKAKTEIRWYDPPNPACCFRAYATLDEGVADYLRLFKTARYVSVWPAILSGDPATFAHELKQHGYYTASEGKYTKTLVALYNEFEMAVMGPDDLHTTKGIQAALNREGVQPPLKVDGDMGPNTKAAIRWFQQEHGLAVDGIVGPDTMRELAHTAKRFGKTATPTD